MLAAATAAAPGSLHMGAEIHGYNGRVLRVDLGRQRWTEESLPQATVLGYLGGRGFTARYCYDEIPPGTDPCGPSNKLIFAVGPLTGTRMPSSGRYAVGCRSPHTGAIIRSISGGGWGAMLKAAGYDVLILEGRAADWTYLSITDRGVEFRDARRLLGLLTEDTEAAIAAELRDPHVKSAVIGPAGERLVSFACIQTQRRSAARGGVGCVMGSKRVKGIAVHGTGKVPLFDQDGFDRLMKAHIKTNFRGAYYQRFHHLGTTGGIPHKHAIGIHPVKNFQRGVFEAIAALQPPAIDASGLKVGESGCWNCYMQCGSVFDVPEGPFAGTRLENPEYETMWSFGAQCCNGDFPGVLAANKICDDYGVDTITAGNAVGFLMECYERGYVTRDDLGGVELTWGNAEAMVEVTRQIVTRGSRAGNWIADGGVRNAARVIGHDSADFAIHIKGLEFAAYDPRGLKAYGVGQATSNMGAHHQICYPVQELFGFPEQVDRFSEQDKGRHAVWSNRYIMMFDCAVACGFPNAFTESRVDFASYPDWVYRVTGVDAFRDQRAMDDLYDRIYTVERAFNMRNGFTAADDTMPKRLMEQPMPDGQSAGHVWHREPMLSDYYRVRRWDEQTGVPTPALLHDLGLDDVASDLRREGILREPSAGR
jgi:aldehyde:ferredoxin oxidoreductase